MYQIFHVALVDLMAQMTLTTLRHAALVVTIQMKIFGFCVVNAIRKDIILG
jgi:hypothetical protein